MNRIFDLIAVGCVAVVVLLPKASVEARPALSPDKIDPIELSRVAALEETYARSRTSGAAPSEPVALDLAEMYLRLEHPDWALVALSGFDGETASAKLWLLRATAHAERLEAALAVSATKAGATACTVRGCGPEVAARLSLIAAPMQALLDENIDPRTDPARAKAAVGKVLHSTRPTLGAGPGPAPVPTPANNDSSTHKK